MKPEREIPGSQLQPILGALDAALAGCTRPVELHEPVFRGNEWQYTKECLDTGWVSSVGKFVDRFEQALADYTGAKHVIVVVNGTAALEMCLRLAGVKPGDEVLLPALTFVATANAVAHCGATPHFADTEQRTLGLDAAKLAGYLAETCERRAGRWHNRRTGAPISAMIVMHTFGHPADVEALREIADRYELSLIEDAAESLGTTYKGRHTGTFGQLGALSFNGNKIVTTGGGGAILTDDPELGRLARHLTTTARVSRNWSFMHDQVGYNYRLPNINAAMGCAQLEQLEGFVARKRALAERYLAAFDGIAGAAVFAEIEGARSNYWLNALLLDHALAGERDALLDATNRAGMATRPIWTLMHRLPMFGDCPRMDLGVAEDLERRVVNLPSGAGVLGGHA